MVVPARTATLGRVVFGTDCRDSLPVASAAGELLETSQSIPMGNPIDHATFLVRARARFGDRYDYSEIVYRSFKSPIKIRCREHPVRLIAITPERHLVTTGGCKYCLRQLRGQLPG